MKRADVGMVQAGDGTRFPLESLTRFGIAGDMRGQDFDGNGAIEPGISGLVDLSHPAFADFLGDFVMGDRLAYQRSLQDRGKFISKNTRSLALEGQCQETASIEIGRIDESIPLVDITGLSRLCFDSRLMLLTVCSASQKGDPGLKSKLKFAVVDHILQLELLGDSPVHEPGYELDVLVLERDLPS